MISFGSQAKQDDDQHSGRHGSQCACRFPEEDADDRSNDGGGCVEAAGEDARHISGQNIPEDAASNSCYDTDEYEEEGGVCRRQGVCSLDSNNGKGGKADGVHEKQCQVVSLPVAGEKPADCRDAEDNRSSCCKSRIARVAENDRRGDAENKVADYPSADRDEDGKDEDAEEVHLFGDAGECPGCGEGESSQEFEEQEEVHAVAWSGQDI